MSESTQQKLSRVRPPRVQITYDVEHGDAFQKKELPLIVGIMADLAGAPEQPLPKLKDRKFVEIDRDNFDAVMKSIGPRIALRVPNTLQKDADNLSVVLTFEQMDDFKPISLVGRIEPLAKLYKARCDLRDLLAKLDGNDKLEALLGEIMGSSAEQSKLRDELKAAAPADAAGSAGAVNTAPAAAPAKAAKPAAAAAPPPDAPADAPPATPAGPAAKT